MTVSDLSNVSTKAADFLVYTDKSKALISLGLLLFLIVLLIYIIYVLITEPINADESKKKYASLERFLVLLAFIFGLLVVTKFSLENISFLFQKEPELII